jgi:hypothetical protein
LVDSGRRSWCLEQRVALALFRDRSELLTRQWRHVDLGGKDWLRLDAGEAKDATAGREFQFTTWRREALER